MAISAINDPRAVSRAIREYRRLGRDAFLKKYGFRRSRSYYLVFNGELFDSKAILAVAHGYQFPQKGPLRPSDFSGGAYTVRRRLEDMGYPVITRSAAYGDAPPVVSEMPRMSKPGKPRWTEWNQLNVKCRYTGPAVYQYRMVNKRGTPMSVSRFLGRNADGVVLIGETASMKSRYRQFVRAAKGRLGHSSGTYLHLLERQARLSTHLGDYRLEYRFAAFADKSAVQEEEARQLKDYVRRLGELPLLNTSLPDRHGDW